MFVTISQGVTDCLHVKEGTGVADRPKAEHFYLEPRSFAEADQAIVPLARHETAILDTMPDMKRALPTSEGKTPRLSTLLRSDGDVEYIAVDGA